MCSFQNLANGLFSIEIWLKGACMCLYLVSLHSLRTSCLCSTPLCCDLHKGIHLLQGLCAHLCCTAGQRSQCWHEPGSCASHWHLKWKPRTHFVFGGASAGSRKLLATSGWLQVALPMSVSHPTPARAMFFATCSIWTIALQECTSAAHSHSIGLTSAARPEQPTMSTLAALSLQHSTA